MIRQISIYRERRELWRGAAAVIRGIAEVSIRDHGCFTIALSGGKTPEELYRRLAGGEDAGSEVKGNGTAGFVAVGFDAHGDEAGAVLPWDKIFVFWGDERFVPHGHPDSNCGMARRALLSRVPIPKENIFPVPTDAHTPEQAAAAYEDTIRNEKHLRREGDTPSDLPSFDLVLLGMGKDGHTASLYPGGGALEEKRRFVRTAEAPGNNSREETLDRNPAPARHRVTMTLPLINNALHALFLVSGDEKKETLMRVLSENEFPEQTPTHQTQPTPESRANRRQQGAPLPAQLVRPRRTLFFFTDVSLWQI